MKSMTKTLVLVCLLTLFLATASCKKSDVAGNENAAGDAAKVATGETSSTPPFATKEAERYQATRVITTSQSGETVTEGAAGSQTFIARDGDRRREDYESFAGEKVYYLQLPEGAYVVLPAKKLYAELKPETGGIEGGQQMALPPDFAPDKLLNETRPESRYEKLGPEIVNERTTTKYRVTVAGKTGAAKETRTESLVWVDESLGMPIRTETTSTVAAGSQAIVTMELRDIKETIDAGMFELPPDYRKVEARELFVHLNEASQRFKGRE